MSWTPFLSALIERVEAAVPTVHRDLFGQSFAYDPVARPRGILPEQRGISILTSGRALSTRSLLVGSEWTHVDVTVARFYRFGPGTQRQFEEAKNSDHLVLGRAILAFAQWASTSTLVDVIASGDELVTETDLEVLNNDGALVGEWALLTFTAAHTEQTS